MRHALSRPTWVWLLLIVATVFSFESSSRVVADPRIATSIVLVVAAIKVRLVGLEFMELRHAPIPIRMLFEAWVIVLLTVMLVFYWGGIG